MAPILFYWSASPGSGREQCQQSQPCCKSVLSWDTRLLQTLVLALTHKACSSVLKDWGESRSHLWPLTCWPNPFTKWLVKPDVLSGSEKRASNAFIKILVWGGGWALRRACGMMSTGCYRQQMGHWTLPLELMLYTIGWLIEFKLKKYWCDLCV